MHSIIREFPSKLFYNNLLTDDDSIKLRETSDDFKIFAILKQYYRRVVFFDILDSYDNEDELSKSNKFEAQFTFRLIRTLIMQLDQESVGLGPLKGKIGIVTPYKG